MRQARLKAPDDHEVAYYHTISRVVNREFVLREEERVQFALTTRKGAWRIRGEDDRHEPLCRRTRNANARARRCTSRRPEPFEEFRTAPHRAEQV